MPIPTLVLDAGHSAFAKSRSKANPDHQKWLQDQLRRWDKGGRNVRLKMLDEIVKRDLGKSGPELDEQYGGGASLLLARILVRRRCKL